MKHLVCHVLQRFLTRYIIFKSTLLEFIGSAKYRQTIIRHYFSHITRKQTYTHTIRHNNTSWRLGRLKHAIGAGEKMEKFIVRQIPYLFV